MTVLSTGKTDLGGENACTSWTEGESVCGSMHL